MTTDDLVRVALLAMLHDKTGLTGSVEEVSWADSPRFAHLEDCPDAAVIGPVECEQDSTSTGTGMEVITARIGCPHGDPIAVKTGGYGIGNLLNKMVQIGQQIEDEREREAP
jgi:hypothetical protein